MVMNRAQDWLNQSIAFFQDAKNNNKLKSYYLCCFLCQQSAEFAIKALCEHKKLRCWGHELISIQSILESAGKIRIPQKIKNAAAVLSKYYISARYPDAYTSGSPYQLFTAFESEQALKFAEEVIKFVQTQISGKSS